jgi:hypothetical protein
MYKAGSVLCLEMAINDRQHSKCEKRFAAMGSTSWSGSTCARVSLICFAIGRSRWQPTAATGCSGGSGRSHRCDSNFGSHHPLESRWLRKEQLRCLQSRRTRRPSTLSGPVKRPTLCPRLFQSRNPGQASGLSLFENAVRCPNVKARKSAVFSRFDRQGPAFQALARHSTRACRHGRVDPTPRNHIPRRLYEACFMTKTLLYKKRRTHR